MAEPAYVNEVEALSGCALCLPTFGISCASAVWLKTKKNFTAGLDSDLVVTSYIVALTSPPDARYSPLTKAPAGPAPPSSFDQVRALVLPVTPEATITKVTRPAVILLVAHMPV